MSLKRNTVIAAATAFTLALSLSAPAQAASTAENKVATWAKCVGDKGPAKCKSQKNAACKAAYNAAFTKGNSSASQITHWKKNGSPRNWKKATANLGFKKAGLGDNFCYKL